MKPLPYRTSFLAPEALLDVTFDPKVTAGRWLERGVDPFELDWAAFLLGAMQHRVESLSAEAIRLLGWDEIISPSVLHALDRRARLAEARFQAHYRALQELRDTDDDLVAALVLFKGAALAGQYAVPGDRMLGDFDVLIEAALAERLAARLTSLGYWEKDGRNGPTFFKDVDGGTPGAGYVAFDVHVAVPTKYNRSRRTLRPEHWAAHTVEFELGGIRCRRAEPALELANLLSHMHEHAASWIHMAVEDDLRLIRMVDTELVARASGVDGPAVWRHAKALGIEAETALGLALIDAVRGRLPETLAGLRPQAEAVRPAAPLMALPTGDIVAPSTLAERARSLSRSVDALRLVPPELRSRRVWFDWKQGLIRGREPVEAIAAQARDALRGQRVPAA